MNQPRYKYIYGPVYSWRLGRSLGVDPISRDEKICSFDCVYCQIGRTDILTDKRENFVDVAKLLNEIKKLPDISIDYITFSGRGEPTLAANLGKMINEVKKIRKEKIAVITNSTLLFRDDVQKDLLTADYVLAKLDASSEKSLELVNHPIETVRFEQIVLSLKNFRKIYNGRLALQIMFMKENKKCAEEIAKIAKDINPDEVQLNTPLRKCASEPLSKKEMDKIQRFFADLNVISVYGSAKKEVKAISDEETLRRRGKK